MVLYGTKDMYVIICKVRPLVVAQYICTYVHIMMQHIAVYNDWSSGGILNRLYYC